MLRSILLIILLLLSSCGRFGGIDIDREHQLETKKIHEECFQLERGDVVHLGFDSSAPLDFNVHRHEGKQVFFAIDKPSSASYLGSFTAARSDNYCLMWRSRQDRSVKIR